jgi:HEAT repeat protein
VADRIRELADDDPAVRRGAAQALGEMGPQAKDAVQALLSALLDDDGVVRLRAAWALWRVDRRLDPVLREIGRGMLDGDAEVAGEPFRISVRLAWGTTRDLDFSTAEPAGDTRPGVDALAAALEDESPAVRRGAAITLSVALDRNLGAVMALLQVGGVPVTPTEAWAERAEALPSLGRALQDADPVVQIFAVEALGRIGADAAETAPALRRALADEEAPVRERAAWALCEVTGRAAEAIPVILALLRDHGEIADETTSDVLGKVGPGDREAIPALVAALTQDEGPAGRLWAVRALARIGPAARAAVPALTASLRDGDRDVRRAAAEALREIDPRAAARAGVP